MASSCNDCPPADPIAVGEHPMPPGRSIVRPRGVNAWVLHYTTRGAARFRHACGNLDAKEGDLVLIAPGTPHHYGTQGAGSWEPLWAVFEEQPHWRELLAWPAAGPGHGTLHLAEKALRNRVEGKLRDAIRLSSEASDYRGALALNALEGALLWCATQGSPAGQVVRDARLQRAISHIHQNFHRPIRLCDVAEGAGISLPHLNRLFRSILATSPGRYLEAVRLKRARELLAYTSMSIQSIAEAAGFESPFYFSNRFHKTAGVSPRNYRLNMAGGQENKTL